ncbi:hypothetical protein Clole_1190 [Cellulosilyticum lentocellum DSM 5427]|uniref:Bacterial repeat domain-containing protein n=2 Tax=Cellulosilyticum lentocellum TaxID=29360 RepID=F2JGG4_CELLD|nr:hypothetical protein Clole_1190 [Cellulosilyticum lentocellum DSM 5427]
MINATNQRLFQNQLRLYGEEISIKGTPYKAIVRKQESNIILPFEVNLALYDVFIYDGMQFITTEVKTVNNVYNVFKYQRLCHTLNVKTNNGVIYIPCIPHDSKSVIADGISISTLSSSLEVRVQDNEINRLITTNFRFFVYDYVWRVKTVSRQEDGILIYYCDLDTITTDDDKNNHVASDVLEVHTYYNLTIQPSQNGTVTSNVIGKLLADTSVTLTIMPNDGYEIDTLTINEVPCTVEGSTYSFTLTQDTIVVCTFKEVVQALVTFDAVADIYFDVVDSTTYSLVQGDTGTLTITKYVDNVATSEVLNIARTDSITSTYCTTSISDNTITVKNVKRYTTEDVTFSISDDEGNSIIYKVKLKGAF